MDSVSVVGLGKLGLCLAGCLAEGGYSVVGVDVEDRVVRTVNSGKAPWAEPGLDDLLARHAGRGLRATTRHLEAIEETDVTFVIVPTPSNPDGSFSNRFVEAALRSLGEALRASTKRDHLFVVSSTVMPGSTLNSFVPILEAASGRTLDEGFSVGYNPDFVALGDVINGFVKPDLVIIGESIPSAGARVAAIHTRMCRNTPSISRMSIASAEVAKVSLNAYITVKISFANSLANMCETLPDTDVDAITHAIGADRRISPHYFQGGLAFGGTCFPRDIRAYAALAARTGTQAELIAAVERVNHHQDERLAARVLALVESGRVRTVSILGLAFTRNTPVVTNSPAVHLIRTLLEADIRVVAYDRYAIDSTRAVFGSAIEYVDAAERCLALGDLAVVMLRDRELKTAIESHAGRPLVVVDCWRQIDVTAVAPQVTVVAPGRYSSSEGLFSRATV